MIDQWRDIDEYRMRVAAHLNRGGELPKRNGDKVVEVQVHPDAF